MLKILKAEKRNSKFLNEHHEYNCEGSNILFESQRQLKPQFDLGARIKSIRLRRGISQKELARLTGVTPSTISQVEKSLIYPSLPALFRIAENLSVEVATLFRGQKTRKDAYVYSAESRSATMLPKSIKKAAHAALLLPPEIDAPVEVALIRILPNEKLSCHFFAYKGEELGYLISGKLEMVVENQSYEVAPGDFIYLQKDTPGSWRNISDQIAELLWIKLQQSSMNPVAPDKNI